MPCKNALGERLRQGKPAIGSGKVAGAIGGSVEQHRRFRGQGFLYCATGVTGSLPGGPGSTWPSWPSARSR
jgi:hypothetical protein